MSLINDALKRASDSQAQAQAQAATRPRGPKGVEDLPVPMTPVSAPERRAWVPVVGIALVLLALLGASAFFFEKWWTARKNFQPYAIEDIDEHGMPRTNVVAKVEPPKVTPATTTNPPVATNPPSVVVTPPTPPKTNPPLIAVVVPPVVPPVVILPPVVPPVVAPPVIPVPVPVIATNPVVPPPKVEPVTVAVTTNEPAPPKPPVPPIPPKVVVPPAVLVAAVDFPELKLQGISRGKKKTFVTVNGKTLSLGDRIEGVTLLKIEADSVTVEKSGAKRELFLLR